jgi:hypothetical protein
MNGNKEYIQELKSEIEHLKNIIVEVVNWHHNSPSSKISYKEVRDCYDKILQERRKLNVG